MDPLSAIGLASAVTQFIDFGFKIGKRLTEYNKALPNEVPRSLQSIDTQLPLLINALQRVKNDIEVNKFDLDTRCILKGVISGCATLVEEVENILNRVAKQQGESLGSKLKKSFASFKYDEKILSIDKSLQTYINILILHHVIDVEDVPQGLSEDVDYYEVKEKRAANYVDRDDLIEKLDGLFYDAARGLSKTPRVVVMIGPKGAGKTQLALEYCRQSHSVGQFKTVFWLNARTPESLDLGLESVAAVIQRTTEGSKAEKLDFVKNFLGERWYRWLLVLDGYDHKAFDNAGPLKNLPSTGYGAVLLTTSQTSAYVLGETITVRKYITEDQMDSLSDDLFGGIQSEDFDRVKRAVDAGAEINALHSSGWGHLARAAIYPVPKIFKYLLDNGADPFFLEGVKAHPMHWASSRSPEIVIMLLDYEDRNDRRQPDDDYGKCLHEALKNGQLEVARVLFNRCIVDPSSKDNYGRTMLWNAVNGKNLALAELIVSRGLLPGDSKERGKCLGLAVNQAGSVPMLKLLVEKAGLGPSTVDDNGTTPLHHACCLYDRDSVGKPNNSDEILSYLLSIGADPNAQGNDTPLGSAACRGSVSKVNMLLAAGADPLQKDNDGHTPLTSVAKHHPEMLPILLGHKPYPEDCEAWVAYLNHALQVGAYQGYRELVHTVLRFDEGPGKADINSQDLCGRTPLLLAIDNKRVETARLLIRSKPTQDIPDNKGNLPLLVAAEKGLDTTVRDLIRLSKQPNLRNKQGDTALCVAASRGLESVVKVLLDLGADPKETNRFGDIPLDLAEEKGHKAMIKLLE
jgi:ankyrin repeat protein